MGKAFGDVYGEPVFLAQLDGGPATLLEVNRHVEDTTSGAAHQFRFLMRGDLVMETPQGSDGGIVRDAHLADFRIQATALEFIGRKGAGKEASLIYSAMWLDDEAAGKISLVENQA